ncbi:SpoIIE family protein phosphatase [Brucepastera parasyntrophica]|uniref:SpoIIE family protein phosphatase n=1 Tax=Brucepastera parasyntrophica TaxID=2880008 RepID=UPI00210A1EA6|nr:SpoIIE family protein phosphatase [Brucepastera parasyntrophica]ULQ58853.1 SpoIIE family protein phosphatase [Brucepastera parasyntrophica]
MSLLFFNYIFAIALFFFSYYLDSVSERNNGMFTLITMLSAFVSLFAGLSVHLLYLGNTTISPLLFRLALICLAGVFVTLFSFTVSVPYNTRPTVLTILNWILILFCVYLVFVSVRGLELSPEGSIIIHSRDFFGLMDGFLLYALIYLVGYPALTLVTLIIRAIAIRSRIYRQRLIFLAVSVIAGVASSYVLYWLSTQFTWAFPLIPFGLAVLLIAVYRSVSITTLIDRSQFATSLVNFIVLGVMSSLLAAILVSLAINYIPNAVVVFFLLVFIVVMILLLRDQVGKVLSRFVRAGSEYERELEEALEKLDFTLSREKIIDSVVSTIKHYVDSSSVEIFVSDDSNNLVSAYTESGEKKSFPSAGNKALNFLLSKNESIVLKTQAITSHVYAEVKPDLLQLFDMSNADAFMMLREGHHVVGMIMFGPKKRGSDYTDYDYTILSKLYSNFFLVMYYLKNIAKESIVLTIDREIEYSAQVITGIQDNIDRIQHPKVDADFITRAARQIGGDFIDFIKLTDEKYLYVMGDVSGKGLNASMSMVILKALLRTMLAETTDFKQLVIKVNAFVRNNLPKGTYFAGVFGLMDFSENTMYYINCGVPVMFLYTASYNNAIEIQGDGKILGFVKDIGKYLKVKKIALNPEDIILMTTDGLIEATNLRGEPYGKDRIQRLLLDNRGYPASRIAKFQCDALVEFVSRELEDDITVLVIKYLSK